MPVSLNEAWEQFLAEGEARVRQGEDDAEAAGNELTTRITLSFSDGREVKGDFVIGFFDNEDGDGGHVGVEVQMGTLVEAEVDNTLLDIIGGNLSVDDTDGWTKESLVLTFNIDPDSPIWEVEDV